MFNLSLTYSARKSSNHKLFKNHKISPYTNLHKTKRSVYLCDRVQCSPMWQYLPVWQVFSCVTAFTCVTVSKCTTLITYVTGFTCVTLLTCITSVHQCDNVHLHGSVHLCVFTCMTVFTCVTVMGEPAAADRVCIGAVWGTVVSDTLATMGVRVWPCVTLMMAGWDVPMICGRWLTIWCSSWPVSWPFWGMIRGIWPPRTPPAKAATHKESHPFNSLTSTALLGDD